MGLIGLLVASRRGQEGVMSVELTSKRLVAGSIPARRTTLKQEFSQVEGNKL